MTNPGAGNGRGWRTMYPAASFSPRNNASHCLLLEAEVLCQHRVQRWAFRNEEVLLGMKKCSVQGNTGADEDLPGRPLPVLGKEARAGGAGRLRQL